MFKKMDTDQDCVKLQVLNDSLSMQELSNSIEEIVSTPDIYLFFKTQNVNNNDILNEIFNNRIQFITSSKSADTTVSSSLDGQPMSQDSSNSQGEQLFSQIVMEPLANSKSDTSNNMINLNEKISHSKHQMNNTISTNGISKEENKGLNYDNLMNSDEKSIKKHHITYSDSIRVYCSKCQRSSKNFSDTVCSYCRTVLLFQCNICNCIYKKLITIQNHLKYECLKKSMFHCAECDFTTAIKLQLIKHIQNEHTSLISDSSTAFTCSVCCKHFKMQRNLLAHERICGMEPFLQCKHCPFKTKFQSGLTVHIKYKHPEFDLTNYHYCPKCGKKYRNLNYLNQHIKMSCGKKSKFECDHCDYKSNRKYPLAKHMQQSHPNLFFKNKFLYDTYHLHNVKFTDKFVNNINNQMDV